MYFQIKLRINGIEIAEKNTFLINRFKKKKRWCHKKQITFLKWNILGKGERGDKAAWRNEWEI